MSSESKLNMKLISFSYDHEVDIAYILSPLRKIVVSVVTRKKSLVEIF